VINSRNADIDCDILAFPITAVLVSDFRMCFWTHNCKVFLSIQYIPDSPALYIWSGFKFLSCTNFCNSLTDVLALSLSPCAAVSQVLYCCYSLVSHPVEALTHFPISKLHKKKSAFCAHMGLGTDVLSACFWLNHWIFTFSFEDFWRSSSTVTVSQIL
jgi:hypothetical protein